MTALPCGASSFVTGSPIDVHSPSWHRPNPSCRPHAVGPACHGPGPEVRCIRADAQGAPGDVLRTLEQTGQELGSRGHTLHSSLARQIQAEPHSNLSLLACIAVYQTKGLITVAWQCLLNGASVDGVGGGCQ